MCVWCVCVFGPASVTLEISYCALWHVAGSTYIISNLCTVLLCYTVTLTGANRLSERSKRFEIFNVPRIYSCVYIYIYIYIYLFICMLILVQDLFKKIFWNYSAWFEGTGFDMASQNSSVSIVTTSRTWRPRNRGSIPSRRKDMFPSKRPYRLWAHPASCSKGTAICLTGGESVNLVAPQFCDLFNGRWIGKFDSATVLRSV